MKVNYDGRTSYLSISLYCCIRREGLLNDAKRNLLVTANFLFNCSQHCELSGQARSTLVMTVSPDG